MRIIKFRIWNGKEMLFPNQITKYANCELGINYAKEYTPEGVYIPRNPSKTHFMQFINVYDKGNKEVYDGDILNHETDGQFTIVWDNDFVGFAGKTEGSNAVDSIHSGYFRQCEIIGNIYENPELLKSK